MPEHAAEIKHSAEKRGGIGRALAPFGRSGPTRQSWAASRLRPPTGRTSVTLRSSQRRP